MVHPVKLMISKKAVCDKQGALTVEDAAGSFSATYKCDQAGMFGTESLISFNGNELSLEAPVVCT